MPTPGSLMTTPQLPAYATDPEFWKRAAAARQRRGAPAQMIETMTGIAPNISPPVSAGPQAAPPAGVQTGELFTEPTRTEGGPLLEGVDMEALFKKIAPFRSRVPLGPYLPATRGEAAQMGPEILYGGYNRPPLTGATRQELEQIPYNEASYLNEPRLPREFGKRQTMISGSTMPPRGLGLPADDMRAVLERQEMVRQMEAQGYSR